jgi:DNA gyrase subunit B
MRELIEGGHLYIAQPPLFRVKKGKHHQYVKDEFLLKEARAGVTVVDADGEVVLHGDALAALVDEVREYARRLERLSRRYPPEVLDAWLHLTGSGSEVVPAGLAESLRRRLSELSPELLVRSIVEESDGCIVSVARGGEEHVVRLGRALVDENTGLVDAHRRLAARASLPVRLRSGPLDKVAETWPSVLDAVLTLAQRGYDVQRYKGLGEMNPEQLWETTMDPTARTLQRVAVEDLLQADTVFTILMGDAVEPRRDFIQKNALAVRNLDI